MLRARTLSLLMPVASFLSTAGALAQEKCFERLDNGVDMTGWHRSETNHHGPGTGWTIEGGAFVGRQTGTNLGGIMMTDKTYQDVEVIFQVKIDWGCDSGFFFRTTAGDRAYQVNVDHLQDAGVGTIYGEGFNTELRYRPYFLSNMGMTATKDPVLTPIFDLATWPTIWKPTDFNEIRARVEGNPPHIQVWISGTKVMDFTDQMLRAEIDATGPLAIQVHGGAERWIPNGSVQFKNIRVKDLTVPCLDGAGGAGGAGGSGGAGGAANGGGGMGGVVASAGQATGGSAIPIAGSGGAASGAGGMPTTLPTAGMTAVGGSSTSTPSSPASNDAGGCGCATTNANGSGGVASLLLLLALAVRRRARSTSS